MLDPKENIDETPEQEEEVRTGDENALNDGPGDPIPDDPTKP